MSIRNKPKYTILMSLLVYGFSHFHSHEEHHTKLDTEQSTSSKWMNAFTATFVISFFPTILLLFIPSKWLTTPIAGGKINIQHFLLAFAAGGLLGDVFLHALPELLQSSSSSAHLDTCSHVSESVTSSNTPECKLSSHHSHHDHSHSSTVGLYILLGFLLFFLVERLASLHLFSSSPSSTSSHSSISFVHKIAPTGWLNLLADSLHNFTDGLALGATHSLGAQLALATTLSVFCHEVPHEVGDVSILMQSGLSKGEAVMMQFGTAGAAFLGTLVGLSSGRDPHIESILLSLTCGGFLYIATVSIIPTLLHKEKEREREQDENREMNKKDKVSVNNLDDKEKNKRERENQEREKEREREGLIQVVGEVVGFSCGIALMYAVTILESL